MFTKNIQKPFVFAFFRFKAGFCTPFWQHGWSPKPLKNQVFLRFFPPNLASGPHPGCTAGLRNPSKKLTIFTFLLQIWFLGTIRRPTLAGNHRNTSGNRRKPSESLRDPPGNLRHPPTSPNSCRERTEVLPNISASERTRARANAEKPMGAAVSQGELSKTQAHLKDQHRYSVSPREALEGFKTTQITATSD